MAKPIKANQIGKVLFKLNKYVPIFPPIKVVIFRIITCRPINLLSGTTLFCSCRSVTYESKIPEFNASPIPYSNSASEKEIKFLNRINSKKLKLITIADKLRIFNLPIRSDRYPAGNNPSMIPIL